MNDAGLKGGGLLEFFEGFGVGGIGEGEVAVGEKGFGFAAHGFGQHGAEDLADGTEVVLGGPLRELQQGRGEHGPAADGAGDGFEFVGKGGVIENLQDDGGFLAVLQRNVDAGAGLDAGGQVVGDQVVEFEGGFFEKDAGDALGRGGWWWRGWGVAIHAGEEGGLVGHGGNLKFEI